MLIYVEGLQQGLEYGEPSTEICCNWELKHGISKELGEDKKK